MGGKAFSVQGGIFCLVIKTKTNAGFFDAKGSSLAQPLSVQ